MRYLALPVLLLVIAGCGGSSSAPPADPNAKEVSPPGDIPDNQAFVRYAVPSAGFTVKVPEGWSRTRKGAAITFTDKLNSVTLSAQAPPAVPGARTSTVSRSAGRAKLELYEVSGKPDPVTGKKITDAVERYTFRHGGRLAVLTLSGPQGADNVDPWRIVTDSVRFTG
jgi:hypothetical protein